MLAPRGTVDAGDAGVRSAGDLSVAALRIANADNFKVGGVSSGVPTVQAPNVTALSEASNVGAATQQATAVPQASNQPQPSVIIVEILGYGGESGDTPDSSEEERRRRPQGQRRYDTKSPLQVVGAGSLNQAADRFLTEDEKRLLHP